MYKSKSSIATWLAETLAVEKEEYLQPDLTYFSFFSLALRLEQLFYLHILFERFLKF